LYIHSLPPSVLFFFFKSFHFFLIDKNNPPIHSCYFFFDWSRQNATLKSTIVGFRANLMRIRKVTAPTKVGSDPLPRRLASVWSRLVWEGVTLQVTNLGPGKYFCQPRSNPRFVLPPCLTPAHAHRPPPASNPIYPSAVFQPPRPRIFCHPGGE